MTREELEQLLTLAHRVVIGTTQAVLKPDAAYLPALTRSRQEYWKARLDTIAAHGQRISSLDSGGCICGSCKEIADGCMYHYAARLQPWNHWIPWNCPTFYDGCNCEEEDD